MGGSFNHNSLQPLSHIMGKKRKASSQAYNNGEQSLKPESSKLIINSYEDVADSEDEFLDNRDKIQLNEGPDAKRRRKIQEDGMRSQQQVAIALTRHRSIA